MPCLFWPIKTPCATPTYPAPPSALQLGEEGALNVFNSKHNKWHTFRFDKVFGEGSAQDEVYAETQPLIRSVLDGGWRWGGRGHARAAAGWAAGWYCIFPLQCWCCICIPAAKGVAFAFAGDLVCCPAFHTHQPTRPPAHPPTLCCRLQRVHLCLRPDGQRQDPHHEWHRHWAVRGAGHQLPRPGRPLRAQPPAHRRGGAAGCFSLLGGLLVHDAWTERRPAAPAAACLLPICLPSAVLAVFPSPCCLPILLSQLLSPLQVEYSISVQLLEIYNEAIRDLLVSDAEARQQRSLPLVNSQRSGFNVPDAIQVAVGGAEEVLEVMARGARNRAVAETKMNDRSSRSHQVGAAAAAAAAWG